MADALRSIIFDLDGTLVDSAALVGAILDGMRAEDNLPPLDPAFYRHWSSRGGSMLVGRALGIEPTLAQPAVDEFRRRYRALPMPGHSLYPGALETLVGLRNCGVKLAICSNKPEHLCQKVLDETGLDIFFDTVVGGDTTAFAKPHPEPLLRAMAAIGAEAANSVMVGDSTVDQKTALAVGMRFVFFAGGYDDGVDRNRALASVATLPALLNLVASPQAIMRSDGE